MFPCPVHKENYSSVKGECAECNMKLFMDDKRAHQAAAEQAKKEQIKTIERWLPDRLQSKTTKIIKSTNKIVQSHKNKKAFGKQVW